VGCEEHDGQNRGTWLPNSPAHIHPEDGNCSVYRNVGNPLRFIPAYPLKPKLYKGILRTYPVSLNPWKLNLGQLYTEV
jgi:hypothetical protein